MLTSNVRTLGLATHRLMARLSGDLRSGHASAIRALSIGGAVATVGLVDTTADVLPGGGAFLLLLVPVMAASTALGFRAGMLALGLVCALGACLLVAATRAPLVHRAGPSRTTDPVPRGGAVHGNPGVRRARGDDAVDALAS